MTTIPEPALPLTGVRREIWDSMWAQPVAAQWSLADLAPLTRLVILQTTLEALSDRDRLAEMRQLEDRFFLNPRARESQHGTSGQSAGTKNRDVAENLVAVLRDMARVERVDEAICSTAVLLGEAVDTDPSNAALWGQFRAALADLRSVGAGDNGDAFADLLAELSAPVPNTPVDQPGNTRSASRARVSAVPPPADGPPTAGGRRGRGTPP